jgi:aminopeptidase
MNDPRIDTLATILVKHSLQLKKGDLFIIRSAPTAAPLVTAVYLQAIKAGAHAHVHLGLEGLPELFYKHASPHQLRYVSPLSLYEIKNATAQLSIISEDNTKALTHVDPKKIATVSLAHQHLNRIFLERAAKHQLRWCLTQYPTNAAAQDADMSLDEYEDFLFTAAHATATQPLRYWKAMYTRQEKIRRQLNTKKTFHITGTDTDLTLSTKGRKWINCYGRENFPDGEVFTGPIETSADGHIRYSFPISHGGREVHDVTLTFQKGKVVKAQASQGEDFLKTMIKMDAGAQRLGEFAFGTNDGITHYTKNTLFDEKIGGTIHLALGSGYPETGSINKSGLHWDMVCDLRKNGSIEADGDLIFKNGRFLF